MLNIQAMASRHNSSVQVAASAHNLNLKFGPESAIYKEASDNFSAIFDAVSQDKQVLSKVDIWARRILSLYDEKPDIATYIDHTYLVILVKLVLYHWLSKQKDVTRLDLESILNGDYLLGKGLGNLNDDGFDWVLHPKIIDMASSIAHRIHRELMDLDLLNISEDLFKLIYQDILGRHQRRSIGEYYTPEWLVQLTLRKAIKLSKCKVEPFPSVLDPACGSGAFLCNAIAMAKNTLHRQGFSQRDVLQWILSNISGVDINPLAAITARANYIMALGELLRTDTSVNVPIHLRNILLPDDGSCGNQNNLVAATNSYSKVDLLVGNPPWVVLRSIKDRNRQDLLKDEAFRYGLVNKRQVHLFTQIDLATIFFSKASDLYLKDGGIIAFVMPRSVLYASIQHQPFRYFRLPMMKALRILDLNDVRPLFNIPACVILARRDEPTKYPVPCEKYTGKLTSDNMELKQAQRILTIEKAVYSPDDSIEDRSIYYCKLRVGASIFPRSLYFIELLPSDKLDSVAVATSTEIERIVKEPWKVRLTGEVELKYIYSTLLAWEIVPFGHANYRPVVLPCKSAGNKFTILDMDTISAKGSAGMTKWIAECEKIWASHRSEKSIQRFPRLLDRLDYNGLLTGQNPSKRYCMMYTATGSNIASCVLDLSMLPAYRTDGREINPAGFVADVKTWIFQTDIEVEAQYLCAILNSPIVNEAIKSWQPRGLLGPRAIHRRPFLLPIPQFDSDNTIHVELADIGKYCHDIIADLNLEQSRNPRAAARTALRPQLVRINELISEILKSQVPTQLRMEINNCDKAIPLHLSGGL